MDVLVWKTRNRVRVPPPHRLNTISIELPASQHVACGLCGASLLLWLALEIVFPLHISSRKVLEEKSLGCVLYAAWCIYSTYKCSKLENLS